VATSGPAINSSALIFDQKGWLAELYQLAQVALIGGSFKEQVHSVMEALGCGLPVLVGPCYKNNREAIEFTALKWQDTALATSLADIEELKRALQKHQALTTAETQALRAEVRRQFLARCSSSEKTYQEVIRVLEATPEASGRAPTLSSPAN
jgi:3-deoxy-D-manno-octulosonic-acid transferase